MMSLLLLQFINCNKDTQRKSEEDTPKTIVKNNKATQEAK